MQQSFWLKNYAIKHISSIFASVFHGIRFKVRRLFVVTTSNFFLWLHQVGWKSMESGSLSGAMRAKKSEKFGEKRGLE
jgi:hypothetical protein